MDWLVESVVFNFLMLGVDLISLAAVWKFRRFSFVVLSVINVVLATCMLGVMVTFERFLLLRLIAYGWFLHAPLVLLVASCFIRRPSRPPAFVGVAMAALWLAISVDAFLVEPYWLTIERQTIVSDKVSRRWRIVLIADLQTDRLGEYERNAIRAVDRLQPDLILMAGDYLQVDRDDPLFETFNRFLRDEGFGAPNGIYVVGGNNDIGNWQRLFDGLPATIFERTESRRVGELTITGLTLLDSFTRNLKVAGHDSFHVTLGHAPDYAQGTIDADLMLAGHTHGGQVCLPWIGPLVTLSSVPRSWASGRTDFSDGKSLIVSRGVGLERHNAPRLRFLCRPQLVVVDIVPNDGGSE